MKTVLQAKENIACLWGYPEPKDTAYRWMKYLLRIEVEDGILLHNVVTGHLILLTSDEANALSILPSKPEGSMKELIANHFLVPEDFNEYRSVKQLRRVYQSRSTGEAINHYVILPTTFCNAHCFYCYESDYPRVHMTEETANKLIDYIIGHRQDKKVKLTWFGGEPLVGIKRIDQISQGLKDHGIPFHSTMISNGYLFNEEIIDRSVELWNLKQIQITLDGTEKVYNRVKAYVNVTDNPFRHVLDNIDSLSAHKIYVNIRLNVDFYNKDDIRVLIDELGERYSGNDHVSVYMNMLFNGAGYDPVYHSTDESVELMKIIDDYLERLKSLKVGHPGKDIPLLQTSQCMADNPHAVEIQPDGSFCRCEHENVLDSYGSIEKGILDPQKPLKWKEVIERSEFCPECSMFPSCYMLRYCMNADRPCVEVYRDKFRKNNEELLRSVYLKSLEGKENETV